MVVRLQAGPGSPACVSRMGATTPTSLPPGAGSATSSVRKTSGLCREVNPARGARRAVRVHAARLRAAGRWTGASVRGRPRDRAAAHRHERRLPALQPIRPGPDAPAARAPARDRPGREADDHQARRHALPNYPGLFFGCIRWRSAAIPPCAATVWLRVGNTFVIHAVLRPASASPRVARTCPRNWSGSAPKRSP